MSRTILILTFVFITGVYADVFRFGFDVEQFGRYNKKDTSLAVAIWLEEIASGSGYIIKAIPYEDVESLAQDFKQKRLDFVTTSALKFVKFFDKAMLEDGFSGGDSDSASHRLVLVVGADRDETQWRWLSEANVLGVQASDLSHLYLDILLLEHKLPDEVTWIPADNYQQALLRLFFAKADAAIVTQKAFDLAVEMNPQMRQRLKVFDTSTLNDLTPSYFRKGTDPQMLKDVTENAFAIAKTVRGKQLLEVFRTDSLIKVSVDRLLPIEKAYKRYISSTHKEKR